MNKEDEKKYFITASSFEELIKKTYDKQDEIWCKEWFRSNERYDFIDVKHQDGSTFHIRSAFYKLGLVRDCEVFIVSSEHNGIMVFTKDDIEYFKVVIDKKEVIIYEEHYIY